MSRGFMDRVDTSKDCWEWQGYRNEGGYGCLAPGSRRDRVSWLAHRYSYTVFVGPIEPGNQIHHKCGNPSCVRPDHLMSVTAAEHTRLTDSHPINKTHCKHGHPFSPQNTSMTIYRGRMHRKCITCRRAQGARRRAARKEATK